MMSCCAFLYINCINIYVFTVINLSSQLHFLIIHQRGTSKSHGNKKETHHLVAILWVQHTIHKKAEALIFTGKDTAVQY